MTWLSPSSLGAAASRLAPLLRQAADVIQGVGPATLRRASKAGADVNLIKIVINVVCK
ncbi:hypothetical protein [Phenylobacterium sp.]|uniref:hypothetical protein n=1 Tax=Phenylobacterium sp. TaxID=1871053 RepID=UPI0035B4BDBD